jgi:hypothetical protein
MDLKPTNLLLTTLQNRPLGIDLGTNSCAVRAHVEGALPCNRVLFVALMAWYFNWLQCFQMVLVGTAGWSGGVPVLSRDASGVLGMTVG